MSKPEAVAVPSTTIRDTLPPAGMEDLEQPLANLKEIPPVEQRMEQQATIPEQALQSREEAQVVLAKQVLALLTRSKTLSPRKQKNLVQCVNTMEKQILFREANVRQLPNLLYLQTETHQRGLVLKETINMHVGAVEGASKKIRKSRKTLHRISKGPLKRINQSFELQGILPTITED